MGSLQYQTFLKSLRLLQSSKKKKKQLAKTCILYIFLESRFSDIRERFGNFAGAYYNILFHCNARSSQKKTCVYGYLYKNLYFIKLRIKKLFLCSCLHPLEKDLVTLQLLGILNEINIRHLFLKMLYPHLI